MSAVRFRREAAIAGAATLLAVAATWPLIPELTSAHRLADRTLDDFVYLWNFWWVHRALLVLHQTPFFCPEIFLPSGVSVVVSPLALPYALVSLPFQAALGSIHGGVVCIKALVFLSFPLAVYGASLLFRQLGATATAAFLGGCVYAFVPFRMMHMGRVHYLAGYLTPFFLWFLLRAYDATDRRTLIRRSLGAGAMFALAFGCDASLMPELAFCGGILWLSRLVRWRRPWQALQRTALCVAAGLLLASPVLVPFLREYASNRDVDVADDLEFHSAPDRRDVTLSPDVNNLAYYLSPSLHETLFSLDTSQGDGSQPIRNTYQSFLPPGPLRPVEATVAAIVLLAVLGAFSLGLGRSAAWPFVLIALLGLALALGPYRSLGGLSVKMPYYYVSEVIPGLKAGRYPAAHLRLLHLGVAAVAALGLGARSVRWQRAALGLPVLAAVGWLCRPAVFAPVPIEPVHLTMRDDPRPGHVLELPHRQEPARRRQALGQILHGRSTMNGPMTRVPTSAWDFHDREPLVSRLMRPPVTLTADQVRQEAEENMAILHRHGIRFVLIRRVFRNVNPEAFAVLMDYLSQHPGLSLQPTPSGHVLATVEDL